MPTEQTATPLVQLSLACNDHRNGVFGGRVSSIAFGDELHLDCVYANVSMHCELLGCRRLRLGRVRFNYHGEREWWGNWCWNLYLIRAAVAANLANYLRASKGFQPDCASDFYWKKWESGELCTATDFISIRKQRA